ncbi:MAG: ferrous iron transport protein A [Sphingomonadales bacterium]|nr:ferrous iron transport protein A [Sphingomonadales bacterium]
MYSVLANLKPGERGHVAAVDWDRISVPEGRRLRELGLVEGANIELLHRGSLFLKDPLAVRVGRTTIVIRLAHAAAISIAEGSAA